ncbi:transcription termination factor MTERF15, mitochondrial-like [Cynara cardunculus var. scolymus]|uniref:transcription termination factor MTERF15, mitochondrial-like n=1 Tax=Cynara cardunculus var. scolymus TaxID=59895 RepID=UPI000D62DF39|nr:transcription termination factor MTERF15, mitochondrial-like [Cynara cardunculus var. scolymus]
MLHQQTRLENKLKPLISEFTGMGFTPNEIREEIIRNPKILGSEVGEMSKCLRMLNSLKCRVPIKENLFSEGAFMASYEVKSRIDCLHKHGLLYRDAFSVLWREPRAILYDLKEIDLKMEFLTNTMKFDVLSLDEVPEYLGVHFEKQIVPRYNVIEHLRSKGGIGDEIGLRSLVKFSRLRFYNLYVKPYPECICKSEWHYEEFVMPITGPKSSLGYIVLPYLELVRDDTVSLLSELHPVSSLYEILLDDRVAIQADHPEIYLDIHKQ